MKVMIVGCKCGNPKPHRKLRTEDGMEESRGFFSVEVGKSLLNEGLTEGIFQQTEEETAETMKAIETCGLPETLPPLTPEEIAEERAKRLEWFAKKLVEIPPHLRRMAIDLGFVLGKYTEEEGEKILAMANGR